MRQGLIGGAPVVVVRFTEVDFQSIQRIGDSLKKEDSKGTKTGRFGELGI